METGGGTIPLFEKVQEATRYLREKKGEPPQAAVILGTGLGGLVKEIQDAQPVPYPAIPHFPVSTVESHAGQAVLGTLQGIPIIAFSGRFHLYEGWTPEQITFPVRVAKALGARALLLSCACGGMNPHYAKGDLALIADQINLMGQNPLAGPNDARLGPRFPDMSAPFDERLLARAEEICLERRFRAHRAVYAGVLGPNLETRAEYRMLRVLGADVVGMSTVPEVIAGVHAGLRVFAVGIVTDLCFPDALKPADIQEIIAVANQAEPKLTSLISTLIRET